MVTKKEKFLAAAQKLLEKGSLDKALVEFQRAVAEDPKDTRTWLRIAEIQVKRGDNERATEVYLKTADLYVEQGFFQRAVAVYKNIVKLSPGYVAAYAKLAEIYKQLGLLSDAVRQFEQVAAIHLKAGRSKDVLAVMRQIVEINPEQPVAHIKLAEAASQAGAVDEAVAEFTRAAELLKAQGRTDEYLRVAERLLYHRPDDVPLLKEVARLYIEKSNARFALARLQACFKLDPRDMETLDMLARAFEQLGQAQKTVAVLKELARVQGDAGRTGDRTRTAQRILALDPGDADARAMLSTGRPAPAPVARPVEVGPAQGGSARITFSEMAVPQHLQARVAEPVAPVPSPSPVQTAERVAIASNILERTEEEAAPDVQRIISEADLFVKYGLVERAVDHLRRVFEFLPTHVGAHERLAAVLMQLGRTAEAVAELEVLAEQVLPSDPLAASDYARRALAVDPAARRARAVLERAERGEPEPAAEEFEEISTGIVEIEDEIPTPHPEPQLFAARAVDEDELVDFGAEGGTQAVASDFEVGASPAPQALMDEVDELTTPTTPAFVEESTDQFSAPEHTIAVDATHDSLLQDLEQVDFFLDQGLAEEARQMLEDVIGRNPPSPLIEDRVLRLAELEREAAPGAVPTDEPSAAPGEAIRPRAMVAGGGEMDLTTHRDLGIGYKDMGLFDAAINEFQRLAQDPTYEVFALTMIGECHEAKGALADAVAFYKRALNRPSVTDTEATALYFQLGSAFQTLGDRNEAIYFFEKVAKRDASFRDVRRRLAEVRDQGAPVPRNAPPPVDSDSINDAFDAILSGKNRG